MSNWWVLQLSVHCPNKIYLALKPDKYGTEFVVFNDARTWYMVNSVYLGKVAKENSESVPSYYFKRLCEPIHESGRNITVNNWFSFVRCFKSMVEDYNLTMLGTVGKKWKKFHHLFCQGRKESFRSLILMSIRDG